LETDEAVVFWKRMKRKDLVDMVLATDGQRKDALLAEVMVKLWSSDALTTGFVC